MFSGQTRGRAPWPRGLGLKLASDRLHSPAGILNSVSKDKAKPVPWDGSLSRSHGHRVVIATIAVWDCGADCPQLVSNLRWSCASNHQGEVSERFARCEQKTLQTGLGFQAPPDMNCSSGYRMPSERIVIRRSYLARW
jgi:hypothetical protein